MKNISATFLKTERLYHLVVIRKINGKTRTTRLTTYPMTHRECMNMKRAQSDATINSCMVFEAVL